MKLRNLIINTFMSILATCCLLNLNVSAEVMHLEGLGYFSYEINNNEAIITSYQLDTISDKLTIPTQIDGYNVVEIGEKAFFMQPTIKEVTVYDSVKNIGAQALGYKEDFIFNNNTQETQEYVLACVKIYNFTIKGYKGTAAETYAIENGFTFIALDESEVTTTVTTSTSTTTETTVSTTATTSIETTTNTEITTTPTVTTAITTTSAVSNTTAEQTTTTETTSIITTATTTEITTTTTEPIKIKGDANGDNKLNVRDCAYIARMLAKGKKEEIPENADFNNDKIIDVRDAAAIARYLALK